FSQEAFLRRLPQMYSATRPSLRALVSTMSAPPHCPHVANPARRFAVPCFGGPPDTRPLAALSAGLAFVSARRELTLLHRSSETMRRCGTATCCHSASGRGRWCFWPQSSRFFDRFHTRRPAYS